MTKNNNIAVTAKKKIGRRPYADPLQKRHKILLYPTFYEIELLGGEEALRADIEAYIQSKVKAAADKMVE